MVKIRYKQLQSGKYSVYLDIYARDANGSPKRNYDFLGIYVSKDYSKIKRIAEIDKEKIELAKAVKAKREIEVINSTHGFNHKKRFIKTDVFKVIEKLNAVKEDYNMDSALKHLKAYSNRANLSVSDMNSDFLNGFLNYLQSKIAHNTTVTYLKRLRSFLNKAVNKKMIPENPMKEFKFPGFKDVERVALTFEELTSLQETETEFNSDIRMSFLFACFSGLRLSDVRHLKWDDIQENQIVIMPEKTSNTTGKMIYSPLTKQAEAILEKIKKDSYSDFIFPALPASSTQISKQLNIWAKKAGINKHIFFHVSRHTFATIGLTFGIDIYTMQKLLGHSSIEMTQVYAKIVDEKKKREVSKFPSFENK